MTEKGKNMRGLSFMYKRPRHKNVWKCSGIKQGKIAAVENQGKDSVMTKSYCDSKKQDFAMKIYSKSYKWDLKSKGSLKCSFSFGMKISMDAQERGKCLSFSGWPMLMQHILFYSIPLISLPI